MTPRLYHLHALSALHCGTGQSAGVVDLPIARDRASNLPLVPGSSLRGVLREEFAGTDDRTEKILFGPRNIRGTTDAHAGALAVGDAHLLVLPVRALAGIVAYATCPFILKRYAKDAGKTADIPDPAPNEAVHANGSVNLLDGKIFLEDLDLTARHDAAADKWAEAISTNIYAQDTDGQCDFKSRFLILPDSVFSFIAETATEIRTRIAIDDETGTVRKGALWYEENLPAESVLWGIYAVSESRDKTAPASADELAGKLTAERLLQLGGKAGVGRGLTRFLSGGTK